MHRVHTDRLGKGEKRLLWDGIVQAYLGSGATLKSYSKEQGLRQDHLSYYVSSYKRKQRSQPDFIPIKLSPTVQTQELRIEVGAIKITLPANMSSTELTQLFEGLKTLC